MSNFAPTNATNLSPLLWDTVKGEVDSSIQAHCIVVAHMDHRSTQQGAEGLEQEEGGTCGSVKRQKPHRLVQPLVCCMCANMAKQS